MQSLDYNECDSVLFANLQNKRFRKKIHKACKIDEYSDTKQARSQDFFRAGDFSWN